MKFTRRIFVFNIKTTRRDSRVLCQGAFRGFRICRHLLAQASICIDCIDYTVQLGGFLRFQCRNANGQQAQPFEDCHLFLRKSISIDTPDKSFRDQSSFNMSGEEQDVHISDEADIHSTCASPENASFITANNSSYLALTEHSDLEIVQQEAEETYFTPIFDKFLQWRQMDRSPVDNSPLTPILMRSRDESTPKRSLCDESLIKQIDMLSLSTPRYSRVSTPTSIKADATLMNVKSTSEGRYIHEDLQARISHTENTDTERPQIVDRDEISARNKTKDELTSDSSMDSYSMDLYSTMESTVPDNDGSSSKVTSDSSIDQFPPRRTKFVCFGDRPSRDPIVAEVKTKAPNPVNAESTRFADHSAMSLGKLSVIGDDEVFETDRFDDLYSRNVELVHHYVERMMNKNQEGGCFGTHWSRKIINISTLCRSKKSKERDQDCAGELRASSPETSRENTTTSTDFLEQRSPVLNLRFAAIRRKRQVQISERPNSGNSCFTLVGNCRSMIVACRVAITTISTLSAIRFCIGPTDVCEILSAVVPRCRPPVTYSLVNRFARIEISNFYLSCVVLNVC